MLGIRRPAHSALHMSFPYLTIKVLLSDKLMPKKTEVAAHHYEGLPLDASSNIFPTIECQQSLNVRL